MIFMDIVYPSDFSTILFTKVFEEHCNDLWSTTQIWTKVHKLRAQSSTSLTLLHTPVASSGVDRPSSLLTSSLQQWGFPLSSQVW